MVKTPIVGFVTYNPSSGYDKEQIANTLRTYQGFSQESNNTAIASYFRQFQDIVTNISVRDGYKRSDYEYYRSSEAIPKEIHAIISCCMEAYRKVGIVRNIIDLMTDFSVKGIKLLHHNPQIQKFYRGWFNKVNGIERSERFLNLLYRTGNAPIKSTLGKINDKYTAYLRSLAAEDMETPEKVILEKDTQPYVIPIRYDFLNPVNVYLAGGELSNFVGTPIYLLKLPRKIIQKILSPQSDEEKALIKRIPADIYNRIRAGRDTIVLGSNFSIYHWKKDDWQELAEPLIFCIFDSLLLLQKMQLADLAALDGAISQIRLWKLGNLEKNLFPTDAAVTKLAEILMSNPGGGAFDLIWGPDLEVKELATNVHQFLGKAKYEPVLESIYSGLGVPPTLTGTANAAGFTNNFISLKTLTERLEYGRSILTSFWNKEIRQVQKAMGFRFPAEVSFDRSVLSDEAAEKALYIQLVDRNYISEETFLERFGECDELEVLRKRREERERDRGVRMPRGGPWMVYEKDYELLKTFVQRGMITPKGAGLEDIVDTKDFIDPRKIAKQKSPTDDPNVVNAPNKKGTGGRPSSSKDSNQRSRTYKIRSAANETDFADFVVLMNWAKHAYGIISDNIQEKYLDKIGKTDVRSLTREQNNKLELMKFSVLCQLEPFCEADIASVEQIINGGNVCDKSFFVLFEQLYTESKAKKGSELTIDETRSIYLMTYAMLV